MATGESHGVAKNRGGSGSPPHGQHQRSGPSHYLGDHCRGRVRQLTALQLRAGAGLQLLLLCLGIRQGYRHRGRQWRQAFLGMSAAADTDTATIDIGTYSQASISGTDSGVAYNHYLLGFPQVTATAAPGSTGNVARLQRFSSNLTTDPFTTDGLSNEESSGPGYDNKAVNFQTVSATINPTPP